MIHIRKIYFVAKQKCKTSISLLREWTYDFLFKVKGCLLKNNKTHSIFYLPNFKVDSIQSEIKRKRDYFEIDNLIFVCHQWKNGIISERIKTEIVLDIGANIGNHTLYYINECNAKCVYAFEPVSSIFKILKKNIMLNHLEDRVTLYNIAAGSSLTNASISHYDEKNIGGTTIQEKTNGEIKVFPIDILKIYKRIGLIKIDVEGFEIDVLKGIKETIMRNMPFIMIEIRDVHFKEANKLLSTLGYDFIEIHPKIEWWDYNDYLFFPK